MKYRLTENTLEFRGKTLYQIKALKDFKIKHGGVFEVKKSDLGGYIEKEYNLSQNGDCWIAKNIYVLENAQIEDDAFIEGIGYIYGHSRILGEAYISNGDSDDRYELAIFDNAKISGNVYFSQVNLIMKDNSEIYGDVRAALTNLTISENAVLCGGILGFSDKEIVLSGNAKVWNSSLYGGCKIYENAQIYGGSIRDNAKIYGNSQIYDAVINGNAKIEGNTVVACDTNIGGHTYLCGNAIIEQSQDLMTFSNIGTLALLQNEEMQHFTFFRSGDQLQMTVGKHFYEKIDVFLQDMKLFCQNLQTILEIAEKRF